jgi:hypothetical protein
MISFEVFAEVDRYRSKCESLRNQAATGAYREPDSVVAIETNGDWRLAATWAYPAFALPVQYA